MKKNLISLAVAASVLGGSAVQAGLYVNPEKTGEVLLFPFYNADNGNATNMHIVNTTNQVKAVKVRFLEHKNSDEVLDFNLYLSPFDHFAFGVIASGDGAAVITADNSCTVPQLGSPNPPFDGTQTESNGVTVRTQPFVNYQYAGGATPDVDSSIGRTRTGHVEVIEMGVVTDGTGASDAAEALVAYATWATHDATGVPANCAGLEAAWLGAEPDDDAFQDDAVTAPTGGLYGLSYHINVESAAAFGFEPTAIDDWAIPNIILHTDPGSLLPSLGQGDTLAVVKDEALDLKYREIGTLTGVEAVTAALMTDELNNDVMVNAAIGGMTDWVVTFPTKRAHVDALQTGLGVLPPFTDEWIGSLDLDGGVTIEKPSCEQVTIVQYDREEQVTRAGLGFSPRPEENVQSICNETAVIAMGPAGTESAMMVETGLTNLAATYSEGWQSITFSDAGHTMTVDSEDGDFELNGLPAIGFAAYKVSNGAMSYGNAAEHKTSTSHALSAD
jgi:hypothetical protein